MTTVYVLENENRVVIGTISQTMLRVQALHELALPAMSVAGRWVENNIRSSIRNMKTKQKLISGSFEVQSPFQSDNTTLVVSFYVQ